ncbi:MAG: hypothetical protein ACRDNF_22100 [Streptosporangiaceae bacterium]
MFRGGIVLLDGFNKVTGTGIMSSSVEATAEDEDRAVVGQGAGVLIWHLPNGRTATATSDPDLE